LRRRPGGSPSENFLPAPRRLRFWIGRRKLERDGVPDFRRGASLPGNSGEAGMALSLRELGGAFANHGSTCRLLNFVRACVEKVIDKPLILY